jgi:hypothetical protein
VVARHSEGVRSEEGVGIGVNNEEVSSERKGADVDRAEWIARLHELLEALDRRVPRPEREGEVAIARDAAALKRKALERIAELES